MAKKILIAFDESENSKRAVEFVGASFSAESRVKLFNVLLDTEALCAMESPELTPYFKAEQSAFCTLEDKKKQVVSQAMEQARQALVNAGFETKNVEAKIIVRKKGVARDIIREAADGGFDLIVLGKQGLSGFKEFFLGSVPQKVLYGAKEVSVLLVD
ncbi:MAG: universal stress protein [Desulfosalsimonadaceae bacterium]